MFKFLLGFLVAILVLVLVVQVVGADTNNVSGSVNSVEMADEVDSLPHGRSSSPYHDEALGISGGGGGGALPK